MNKKYIIILFLIIFNNSCYYIMDRDNPYDTGSNGSCKKGPAGGCVFYDKGSYSDGWRYMEAAPSDQCQRIGIQWYNVSYTTTGATGTAIGTGQANTTAIVTSQGAGSYAAKLCDDLVIGEYSDWFLPSRDELNLMYTNLKAAMVVGDGEDIFYWSSSESSDNDAWALGFKYGTPYGFDKGGSWRVRAVRAY